MHRALFVQLLAMAELHHALKRALSPPEVTKPNPWVTDSKLCARKRPDLFPVRDSVVCAYLGLIDPKGNYEVDWQVFLHVSRQRRPHATGRDRR